ncbi:zf-RING_2 domain-containing protein [Cephalotus follicularis]|uniref:Zf-RING_2 domain-containing protein n=1 Tax=Cephalotus follicularis TaxID=3775 RepID=A0A1Q3BTE8_CEPFO|nr:zf-RING_2 domain-containing protein [Cephalotus follicularis]
MPHHHHHYGGPPPPKLDPRVLSVILKAIIMTFITSFFFLLLGLASVLLFPLLLATYLHHHHHHNRRRHQQQHPSNGLSSKHLKKLPQFRYVNRTAETEVETQECVVCLDTFQGGQWCRMLFGCGHVFHRRCVDTWLLKVSSCPVCRTRVRFDFDQDKDFWAFSTRNNHFRVC